MIAAGFDQEAAAALMARIAVFKAEQVSLLAGWPCCSGAH
jgi:hypothetical protein